MTSAALIHEMGQKQDKLRKGDKDNHSCYHRKQKRENPAEKWNRAPTQIEAIVIWHRAADSLFFRLL